MAETHPERVARLVLIGSAVMPLKQETRELQAAVHTLEDPVPAEFALRVPGRPISTSHCPKHSSSGLWRKASSCQPMLWQRALDGILAVDDAADLLRITAPTLLIWGERDGFFSHETRWRGLAEAIPDARLRVYPETGHAVQWERPERVASDLDTFVREG